MPAVRRAVTWTVASASRRRDVVTEVFRPEARGLERASMRRRWHDRRAQHADVRCVVCDRGSGTCQRADRTNEASGTESSAPLAMEPISNLRGGDGHVRRAPPATVRSPHRRVERRPTPRRAQRAGPPRARSARAKMSCGTLPSSLPEAREASSLQPQRGAGNERLIHVSTRWAWASALWAASPRCDGVTQTDLGVMAARR